MLKLFEKIGYDLQRKRFAERVGVVGALGVLLPILSALLKHPYVVKRSGGVKGNDDNGLGEVFLGGLFFYYVCFFLIFFFFLQMSFTWKRIYQNCCTMSGFLLFILVLLTKTVYFQSGQLLFETLLLVFPCT